MLASEQSVSLGAEWVTSSFVYFLFISFAMNYPGNLLYIVSLKNVFFCLLQLICAGCFMIEKWSPHIEPRTTLCQRVDLFSLPGYETSLFK
jgi:hypothetical protein